MWCFGFTHGKTLVHTNWSPMEKKKKKERKKAQAGNDSLNLSVNSSYEREKTTRRAMLIICPICQDSQRNLPYSYSVPRYLRIFHAVRSKKPTGLACLSSPRWWTSHSARYPCQTIKKTHVIASHSRQRIIIVIIALIWFTFYWKWRNIKYRIEMLLLIPS